MSAYWVFTLWARIEQNEYMNTQPDMVILNETFFVYDLKKA